PVAQYLGVYLRARGVPVTVTTLNPDLAAQAEAEGHTVVRGEVIKAGVLHDVGMDQVRLIVICEHSGEETTHIAEALRNVAPGVPIVARPVESVDVPGLSDAGVARVVDSQRAVAQPLTRTVLDVLGVEHFEVPRPDPTVVVDFAPDAEAACPHAEEIRPVLPKSPGCTACLSRGRHDWVHLRICLTCGFVGCCNSSPGRHAQEHAESVGHPMAMSAEPGEVWAWCFLDEAEIGPAQVDAPTS
ncbi:UBP-type zinc finger domain-containing protein, partial [Nocardiopsis gilva]